jgi:methionyl-tRNA formyltransferase
VKITILNSSESHPINYWLKNWTEKNSKEHEINLVRTKEELDGGDILFLISCSEIIKAEDRAKYQRTLVIHASDLPKGRGWSPHVWEIVNGAKEITVTLLEASDKVDAGDIWQKVKVKIPETALYDEINGLLFTAELVLMDYAVENFATIKPEQQSLELETTYWPKRTPKDSELDIKKSIDEQFDLIRVCDPKRFPAFFYRNGKKYLLKIEAVDEKIHND